jgi:hypothetical protein
VYHALILTPECSYAVAGAVHEVELELGKQGVDPCCVAPTRKCIARRVLGRCFSFSFVFVFEDFWNGQEECGLMSDRSDGDLVRILTELEGA